MRLGFGFLLLAAMSCATHDASPAFLIKDGKTTNHVVAVFVPAHKLREHNLTPHQYEKLLKGLMDATAYAVASAVADMFSLSDASRATSAREERKTENLISPEGLDDLLAHTRVEEWRVNPDGTHVVLEVITLQKGQSQRPTGPNLHSGAAHGLP